MSKSSFRPTMTPAVVQQIAANNMAMTQPSILAQAMENKSCMGVCPFAAACRNKNPETVRSACARSKGPENA